MNISFSKNIYNYSLNSNNRTRENYNCASQQSFGGIKECADICARKLADNNQVKRLLSSNGFNKFLKSALENPGVNEAVTALAITCTARPLTIMATPGAKKEDKQYAAAQSFTSGITGLAFAYILFNPIKKSFEKVLQKVNANGVKNTLKALYTKDEYKELIDELIDRKIIPDRQTFNKVLADDKKNPFVYLKKFLNGELNDANAKETKSAKKMIEELLASDNTTEKQAWDSLVSKFSKALSEEFDKVKEVGVKRNSRYLIHKSFEFLREGKYSLSISDAAGKAQNIYNFGAKFILFPITAFIMIWCIPKVMKLLFPNHKKSKKKDSSMNMGNHVSQNLSKKAMHKRTEHFESAHVINNSVFNKFNTKPAMNKQVSFSGGFTKACSSAYSKVYEEPFANLCSKLAEKIACSDFSSRRMNRYMQTAYIEKYGVNVPLRDVNGKIMNQADNSFFLKNIANIVGIWGSCFYIFNTIRNKEIEPERKPALCTNMAIVAIFSAVASASIYKFTTPVFDALRKIHESKMGDKLNYNSKDAWNLLRQILTSTLAFRYLGPVLATPAADKLVKLFGNQNIEKH